MVSRLVTHVNIRDLDFVFVKFMSMSIIPMVAMMACSFPVPNALAQHTDNAATRIAIEKSLPYLSRESDSWMAERGCVSCHRVSFMIWSHNDAKHRSFEIDDTHLQATTNWALTSMLADCDEFGGADTISQMLLGRAPESPWRAKPPRHFKSVDPFEALFEILLDRQRDDGSWPPEGQLSTPAEISTGWALLALNSFGDSSRNPAEKLDPQKHLTDELAAQLDRIEQRIPVAIASGRAYLAGVDIHPTNEGLLLRLLRTSTDEPDSRERLLAQLFSRQNPDGGWSNRFDQVESDAYATGQTLYALSRLEALIDRNVVDRGIRFLTQHQQDNGSWQVPATRIRDEPSNESLDEIFSYWGTAWATIGLLHSLPMQD